MDTPSSHRPRRRGTLVPGAASVAVLVTSMLVTGGAHAAEARESPEPDHWPSLAACEPWPAARSAKAGPATRRTRSGPVGRALVRTLSDPALSAMVTFSMRNLRGGGLFVDGQPIDADIPVLTIDHNGKAILAGADYLAYSSLAEGSWAHAEIQRGSERLEHNPYLGTAWGRAEPSTRRIGRLPELFASVVAAVPADGPPAGSVRWYDVTTSSPARPGTLWDTTVEVFPVLRHVASGLRVGVDESGVPQVACLAQRWWQGYDDTLGEEAWLLTALRFERVGEAPVVPAARGGIEADAVPELELRIARPPGWDTAWVPDGDAYWLWKMDQDELPRIRVTRCDCFEESVLETIEGLPLDEVLDGLAYLALEDAKEEWGREPRSVEVATLGGEDGREVVPARLLVHRGGYEGLAPHTVIDVVAWRAPYLYVLQLVTAEDDELSERYLFERLLETVEFDAPRSS